MYCDIRDGGDTSVREPFNQEVQKKILVIFYYTLCGILHRIHQRVFTQISEKVKTLLLIPVTIASHRLKC